MSLLHTYLWYKKLQNYCRTTLNCYVKPLKSQVVYYTRTPSPTTLTKAWNSTRNNNKQLLPSPPVKQYFIERQTGYTWARENCLCGCMLSPKLNRNPNKCRNCHKTSCCIWYIHWLWSIRRSPQRRRPSHFLLWRHAGNERRADKAFQTVWWISKMLHVQS